MEGQFALALEDFIPVVLSATGLFFIARKVSAVDSGLGRLAVLGFFLIALGGFAKAAWKLIFALTGLDLVWLDNSLFILLAPGFILLTWALLWEGRLLQGRERPRSFWVVPLGLTAAVAAAALLLLATAGGRAWFFQLLGVTTVANFTAGYLLIRQAAARQLQFVALLFARNLLLTLGLAGMARIPDQTVGLQWIEQIVNTFSQGAFAYAAWRLYRFFSPRTFLRK